MDERAKAAAERWSLIPCGPDKRPLIGTWKPNQARRFTLAELEEWERSLKPAAWAVVCGEISGVVCLDFDGAPGQETAGRLGLRPHVITPSGGYHVYVEHPGAGRRVKTLNAKTKRELAARYPGLDIRADGGYALAFGHNAAGDYAWTREPEPEPISALPRELSDFLGLTDYHSQPRVDRRPEASPAGDFSPSPEFWIVRALTEARSQGRNNGGHWLACQLRDNGISEAEAAGALRAYVARVPDTNTKGAREPYTWEEAAASLRNAYAARPREKAINQSRPPAPPPPARPAPPAAPPEPPRVFPRTDLGNAERLRERHKASIRFCHAWGAWLVWDGHRWEKDNSGAIYRYAADTVRHILAEAAGLMDSDQRKEHTKWARQSESRDKLKAMIELCGQLSGIAITPAEMDLDPWLLNCQNGTLDLRAGQLRPQRREDLITRICPVDYDQHAPAPTWKQFVDSIMLNRESLAGFLQRATGYALTGLVTEKVCFILHGGGDNGKTTFLEAIKAVLGDYSGQVLIETLMVARSHDGGPSPDIADLRGVRFITSSEVEDGQRLAESRIKYLTGMSTIKTRRLYEDTWEFQPQFTIFLDCNHLPAVRGTDRAIWDRLKRIPFDLKLEPHERDRHLMSKLMQERAGILRWAVEGCKEWAAAGLGQTEEVTEATALYRGEMDVIGRFLEDTTATDGPPTMRTQARTLYRAYREWCAAAGEYELSERKFGERLTQRGIIRRRTESGNVYQGIRLKDSREAPQDSDEDSGNPVGMYGQMGVFPKSPPKVNPIGTFPKTSPQPYIHTADTAPEEEFLA